MAQGSNRFDIQDLGGLNLNIPQGRVPLPLVLDNIVLNRAGGYACSPTWESVGNNLTISAFRFGADENVLLTRAGIGFPGGGGVDAYSYKNNVYAQITNPRQPTPGYTLPANGSYMDMGDKSGVLWDPYASGVYSAAIIENLEAYYPLEGNPFTILPSVSHPGIVDAAGVPIVPGPTTPYFVESGADPGWNPDQNHYLIVHVVDANFTSQYVYNPVSGQSYNPGRFKPQRIAPTIIKLGTNPVAGFIHYVPKIRVLSTEKPIIYGAALPGPLPARKPYLGMTTVAWSSLLAVAQYTVTIMTVTHTLGSGESTTVQRNYVASKAGSTGATQPIWSDFQDWGSVVVDGTVTWVCVGGEPGPYGLISLFPQYLSLVALSPNHFSYEDVKFNEKEQISNQLVWSELKLVPTIGAPFGYQDYLIYRVPTLNPTRDYLNYCFLPLGVSARYKGRTWVAAAKILTIKADSVLDVNNTSGPVSSVVTISIAEPRTLYYSELGRRWVFYQNFIVLPFQRSNAVTALRSTGDALVALGNEDAVVLQGDSEANFIASSQPLLPGISQSGSIVIENALYYLSRAGLYRVGSGAGLEKLSNPIEPSLVSTSILSAVLTYDEVYERLVMLVNSDKIYVYDTRAKAWTTLSGQNLKPLVQAGRIPYAVSANQLYRFRGPPGEVGAIQFSPLEIGSNTETKRIMGINMPFESTGSPTIYVGFGVLGRVLALDKFTAFAAAGYYNYSARIVNASGTRFNLAINLYPNASNFILRGPIEFEVYDDGITRMNYS